MRETQETVHGWAQLTFGHASPWSARTALRCLEEVVELALSTGALPHDINDIVVAVCARYRGMPAIGKELGDVGVTLYRAASVYGYNLHDEIDKCMHLNRNRKWERYNDGTGQHIKE